MLTINSILIDTTKAYLDNLDLNNIPEPSKIEADLIKLVNKAVAEENQFREKGTALKSIQRLDFCQVAMILQHLHYVKRLTLANLHSSLDTDVLAMYITEGEEKGTYTTSLDMMRKVARTYNPSMKNKEFEEVVSFLRDRCNRVERCSDRDMIAVKNGIFNYKTKELMPFSPDYVFTTKCGVNYNKDAKLKVFKNPDDTTWDVETWMSELSDDPEIVNVLWEILSAIIRPNVRWNKSAWLYSDLGNNGKGTLCELMRNLCGHKAHVSIPISDFSKDFMLEPLIRSNAIIVDENDVGVYIDRCANLKAVITNDLISINIKFKAPITYQFKGFMVQCLNEYPRIKDRTDSFYRRQLFIPMEKCFTGIERPYIKNVYLHDKEVLEYVLKKVLNTDFYQLSEPERCKLALEDYKKANDPIRDFFDELRDEFVWEFLPYTFLYDLYTGWNRKYNPQGKPMSKSAFIKALKSILRKDKEWAATDNKVRSSNRFDKPEPLISEYELKDWINKDYVGKDQDKINTPSNVKEFYKGLIRIADLKDTDEETEKE